MSDTWTEDDDQMLTMDSRTLEASFTRLAFAAEEAARSTVGVLEVMASRHRKWDAPMIIGTVLGAAILAFGAGYLLHWMLG